MGDRETVKLAMCSQLLQKQPRPASSICDFMWGAAEAPEEDRGIAPIVKGSIVRCLTGLDLAVSALGDPQLLASCSVLRRITSGGDTARQTSQPRGATALGHFRDALFHTSAILATFKRFRYDQDDFTTCLEVMFLEIESRGNCHSKAVNDNDYHRIRIVG